jgi:SAM-dependent methyltransferase
MSDPGDWGGLEVSGAQADVEHWRRAAAEWVAWAREPGHDAFWAYRSGFAAFLGRGSGEALEVGCGEGRVSRLLGELGYRVTATDPVADLVAEAEAAGSASTYRIASAGTLPFPSERFDLVVAYNVLMDVADVPGAVREMRRVLRPEGTLGLSLVHPFSDRGEFYRPAQDAPFVLRGSYFGRRRFEAYEVRGAFSMHFAGWSLPLEMYAAALEAAGLAIVSLREPVPDGSAAGNELQRWNRVPLFLWLKARPLAGAEPAP